MLAAVTATGPTAVLLIAVACASASPASMSAEIASLSPTPIETESSLPIRELTFAPSSVTFATTEVVKEYLDAFQKGDCVSARKLWLTGKFPIGSGELCSATILLSYRIDPEPPAAVTDSEQVVAVTLTTTGTADRTIESGDTTWFYDMKLQPNGVWLIVQGGSGP